MRRGSQRAGTGACPYTSHFVGAAPCGRPAPSGFPPFSKGGVLPGGLGDFLLLALFAFALALTACGGEAPTPTTAAATPVAVEVQTVERQATSAPLEVTGTVEAIRRVNPGSKLLGRVAVVAVREGEAVRQGQVLARIESADLEANLARARAAVAQAQAELDNASAQQQRYEALAARGSVTPRALEDVTTRLQVAAAALDQARAAARASEVQLGYAVLTSPLEGWVVERRVEAGDMVAPGAVLFTLEDLRQVKVVVEIPEEAVARGTGKTGSAVEVAILGENYPGVIGHLLPAGNPASRTFAAHIFLENPQGTLRSGMFARVRLESPASQRSDSGWTTPELWVPATALVRRGQMEGLYVVDESAAPPRARLRWLRVGAERDGAVQILAGLEPGERFLPTPPADLGEGAPLRVIRVEGPAEVPAGEVSHD